MRRTAIFPVFVGAITTSIIPINSTPLFDS